MNSTPSSDSRRQERDHHSSYKRTYFNHEIFKERISFFLESKLSGYNLDIGWGWYQHYPNSCVVDLSVVALKWNINRDRLQFDMDLLAGEDNQPSSYSLPFADNSFDSATMISVFQYLKNPRTLIRELQRVLKPWAKVYIIWMEGHWLSRLRTAPWNSEDIKELLWFYWIPSELEIIPFSEAKYTSIGYVWTRVDTKQLFSLSFTVPEHDLYATNLPEVKEDAGSQLVNVLQSPAVASLEDTGFVSYKIAQVQAGLAKLGEYPVTSLGIELKEHIQSFCEELYRSRGIKLLCFNSDHPIFWDMMTQSQPFSIACAVLEWNVSTKLDWELGELLRQSIKQSWKFPGISLSLWSLSPFVKPDASAASLLGIFSYTPLNSFAVDFKEATLVRCQQVLKKTVTSGSDEKFLLAQKRKSLLFLYCRLFQAHKQSRKIEELIVLKEQILSTNLPVVGSSRIEIDLLDPVFIDTVRHASVIGGDYNEWYWG